MLGSREVVMSPTVRANYEDEHAIIEGSTFEIDSIPDSCPICHQGIEPIKRFGWFEEGYLYLILQCPKDRCRTLHIAHYSQRKSPSLAGPSDNTCYFRGRVPWKVK
jgi:hypothetical protein